MKTRLYLIVAVIGLLLVSISSFAQDKKVCITLNSGAKVTGILKSFDPATGAVVNIAGVDSKVEIKDIADIKELDVAETAVPLALDAVVAENGNYPEKVTLEVAGKMMDFILVQGGSFTMGFDGPHSLIYGSEPKHKVNLTAYYLSKDLLTKAQVEDNLKIASVNSLDDASDIWTIQPKGLLKFAPVNEAVDKVIAAIDESLGLALRLPTEAEWEYVFADKDQMYKKLNNLGSFPEICYDYWGKYTSDEQTNPTGVKGIPETDIRISRNFSYYNDVYARKLWNGQGAIRLAIKAADLVKSK